MSKASSPLAFVARNRVAVASWTALTVITGVLVFYSVNSLVYPVHQAELNDGGVWVTSKQFGLLGRENRPIGQADALIDAGQPGDPIDVLQNQSAVVQVNGDSLVPIDVITGKAADGQGATVKGSRVFLGGDAIGVVDPSTGSAWVGQVDPKNGNADLSGLDQSAKPTLEKLGGGANGTASVNGTVFVASGETGQLATMVAVQGAGALTKAPLSTRPQGAVVQMTAVGDHPVVLDQQGTLILPDGQKAEIGMENVQLEQPSADATQVVYADGTGLHAVSLSDGSTAALVDGGDFASSAKSSAPVVVGHCAYGVWSDGHVASNCGPADAHVMQVPDLPPNPTLEFRVNRNEIVLNDVISGALWSVSPGLVTPLQTLEQAKRSKQKPDNGEISPERKSQPPTLPPLNLGARNNDATTVLHVLDDAQAAPNAILAITGVKPLNDSSVSVAIGPDRQTLLVTAHQSASGTKRITFTVDDGLGNGKTSQADGVVNLAIKSLGEQSPPPTQRSGYDSSTDHWVVPQSGSLDIPITANWRNKLFGDPVVLKSVSVESGRGYVQALPNGAIHYVAPSDGTGSHAVLSYTVTAGGVDAVKTLPVDVRGTGDSAAPPSPQPDAVAGVVNAPITVHPLANDRPGADPSDPYAPLQLVSPGGHSGLNVTMDAHAGTITIVGSRACVGCLVTYTVGQGSAPQRKALIRVDVAAKSATGDEPVTVPVNVVVRGSSPALVDVLANDYDPRGGLLVVQDAAPARSLVPSRLDVSVVSGRWIRVSSPVAMSSTTQTVTYNVSNGSTSAVGTVTVTQLPAVSDSNVPVVEPMNATVRAGYAIDIPVLDNASTPSGDPVALAPTSRGTLQVTGDGNDRGTAYVVGNMVRYVPPTTVTGPTLVEIGAPVINAADPTATAVTLPLSVTINPPGPDADNPPAALPIIGRVVQGGIVTLKLPTFGADPDGDPVSITEITSSPTLGRILAVGANSITYQALPSSAGTDSFSYAVTDPYGLTDRSGTVQVGIAPPGVPQAPVAQNMLVRAAPGRSLALDALGHVLHPANAKVWLKSTGPAAHFEDPFGAVLMTAPEPGNPVVVSVTVTNGVAQSTANVTVEVVPGFENAPQVNDLVAEPKPEAQSVKVDVLSKVYDLDDSPGGLKISSVGAGGTVDGSSISAQVLDKPQVISFVVVDAHGGQTSASLYVPPSVGSTPYLKPDARLEVDPQGSVTAKLSELAVSPLGKPLYLTTTSTFGSAPSDQLVLSASGQQAITVTAPTKASGPGLVSFEVSDSPDGTNGNTAIITVPVQIGASVPVISCPDGAVPLYQGGDAIQVDVSAVCQVWTANPATAAELKYQVDWQRQVTGVSKGSADRGFTLLASPSATLTTGAVTVSAGGSNAAEIRFEVRKLPPPVVTLGTLTCIVAKPCAEQDLTRAGVFSYRPKEMQDIVITDVSPTTDVSWSGGVFKFRPTRYIPATPYRVTVNDAGGQNPSTHSSTGQIVLAGIAAPEPPQNVTAQSSVFNGYVQLKWDPSKSNGSGVDSYVVQYSGGAKTSSQDCGPGTSCQVKLPNSPKAYSFTVKAHNIAGFGNPSATPAIGYANIHPGAVVGLKTDEEMDTKVQVSWASPAASAAAGTVQYRVKWSGGDRRGVGSPFTVTGLTDGTPTAVTVFAYIIEGNGKELSGPGSPTTVVAAGKPEPPPKPTFEMTSSAGSNQAAIVVSWDPTPNPRGKSATYQVTRTGGTAGTTLVCSWTPNLSCPDRSSLETDGTKYSYTVEARNDAAYHVSEDPADHTSAPSEAGEVQVFNTPDPVDVVSSSVTATDRGATMNFKVGNSHGPSNHVFCTVNGNPCSGTWTKTFPQVGGNGSATLTGLTNGTQYDVKFYSCNDASNGSGVSTTSTACGPTGTAGSVTPYGPIGTPTITATRGASSTSWSASVDANGASVHITVTASAAGGGSWSYNSSGAWSDSQGDPVGFGWTGHYTITVTDTSGHGRQNPPPMDSNTVSTDPPSTPPTLFNYKVIVGGCLCQNGQPTSGAGQIGISWDASGGVGADGACYWSVDGTTLPGSGGFVCGNYHASRQFYNQATGLHTYCGWVIWSNGQSSNKPCTTVNVK